MKKIKLGLFPKVVLAIALGALLGMFLPDWGIRILKTFNVLFAQLLKFIVPLLVLGLVTPAIASLGRGAGKMLLAVMVISYCSTVCAGFFAYGMGEMLLPNYLTQGELADAAKAATFEPYFNLKIQPICDILTALIISFVCGLGIIFTETTALKRGFDDFGQIIKLTIEKVIIPLLPWYIFSMIAEMSAAGTFASIMGAGLKVIATGVALSIVFLFIQYGIAGTLARKNPFRALWNMFPAYLTGFSICSSSAVIPVTHRCTLKNGVPEEVAGFVIPLCANVHMCGSTIKLAVTTVAVCYMSGLDISFAMYANFFLLQAIAAVAAPGVMGGVLMASVGLLETVLGFTPEQAALVMTIYLALDGYGPACNVTGDGAVALVVNRFFGKK